MAAFLSELNAGIKLKKTTTVVRELGVKGFIQTDLNVEENDAKVLSYNIEHYSDLLEPVSMATKYCELSIQDAEMLRDHHELVHDNGGTITEEMETWRDDLISRLTPVMEAMNAAEAGVFIKTSCRSPKDSPNVQNRLAELYQESLEKLGSTDEVAQVRSMLKAGHECMRTYSAEDAVIMLMQSKRIYTDMTLALKYPERWTMNIVVREWKEIDFELEFRTFYCNGTLNAISQYSTLLYNEFIHHNKDLITVKLLDFFYRKVKPILDGQYDDAVIDFGFKDENLTECYVIELNPYAPNSDACLFMWGRDREVFDNGPLEMRVLTEQGGNVTTFVSDDWKDKLIELNEQLGITS